MNKEFWEMLERIVEKSNLIIDRPQGSIHPKYSDIIYEINYGYLENTTSMDNGGIDCWCGSMQNKVVNGIVVTVDEVKNDSEIKILISCNEEEIKKIISFHNNQKMKGIYIKNETRTN